MANYIVRADQKITLLERDPVKRILQNVAMCIRTKRGTCPMHRGFGSPQRYVDMPFSSACAIARAEISEAVMDFEPRANIVGIEFERDEENGVLLPIVEVSI